MPTRSQHKCVCNGVMHTMLAPSHRPHPRCGLTLECWAWSLSRARRMGGWAGSGHARRARHPSASKCCRITTYSCSTSEARGRRRMDYLAPVVAMGVRKHPSARDPPPSTAFTVDDDGPAPSVHRCQRPHGEGGNVCTWQARCRLVDVRGYRGIDVVVRQQMLLAPARNPGR